MRRAVVLLAGASLAFALAACAGSDPKAEMLAGIRSAALARGLTQTQVDCVIAGLKDLTVEQLTAVGDGKADATTTQAYTMVAAQCLLSG